MKEPVSVFAGAVVLSFLALASACGGGDDASTPDPMNEGGGDATQAGTTSKSGSSSTQGGTKASGSAGEPTTGEAGEPAMSNGGTTGNPPEGEAGAAGTPSEGPGGLGTANGISGAIDGVVHAHTFNAVNVPQQSETVVIGATSAMYPLYDSWGLRFLPQLGEQACTGDTGTEDIFITFGSQTNYNATGTTTGKDGACTINVTSIAPSFEGTFTATFSTPTGIAQVTSGEFRIPH